MAIEKLKEFEMIYPTLNLKGLSFLDIVNEIEKIVVQKSTQPITTGSLNNCRGTWYELAFIMEAHQSILRSTEDLYLVKMGNETSIKFWEIYQKESRQQYNKLIELFSQRQEPIFVRCSTPDFVVISKDIIQNSSNFNILQKSSPSLQDVNELYKIIKNKCSPEKVKGFISLKTSNRPDRRYQILLEANVTKFAGRHIHDREHRLRYDIIGESNSSDTEVFRSPLMSTVPMAGNNIDRVERVIDSEVNIISGQQLDNYWQRYEEITELDLKEKVVSPVENFANDHLDL